VRARTDFFVNCFKADKPFSSSVIEGRYYEAKVTLVKSCGMQSYRFVELSLHHLLGKLPMSKLAHRFFWRREFPTPKLALLARASGAQVAGALGAEGYA